MKELVERARSFLKTRVARNLFWISLGTGVAMLFGFLGNVYLARTLLPDGFGKIMYAQTWVQYLILIIDFGLSTYAIREIAKQKGRLREFAHNIVPFRLVVSLILFALFSFVSWIGFPSYEMKLLVISSSLMIFASALNVEWAFQGLERMKLAGVSRAMTNLAPLLLFLLFVKSANDLLAVPLLKFSGAVLVAILMLVLLRTRTSVFHFDRALISGYLRASVNFWLLLLLIQVYHGADIIILGIYQSPEQVGLYAASFRLMSALIVGLGLMNTAIFPILSDYGVSDMRKFFILRKAYLVFSVLAGSLMVILFFFVGHKVILFVFGEAYEGSTRIFQILVVGLGILMCNGPYSQSLLAKGFERHVLIVVAVCAILNVVLNLTFIPHYGGLAAAVSYVISQLIGTVWVARIYYSKVQNEVS